MDRRKDYFSIRPIIELIKENIHKLAFATIENVCATNKIKKQKTRKKYM